MKMTDREIALSCFSKSKLIDMIIEMEKNDRDITVLVGTVTLNETLDRWSFETKDKSYSEDVCAALDQMLNDTTCNGETYKVTIEKI